MSKDKEQKRHAALLKITPSANHLIALQQEFADSVTADIFAHMQMTRLRLADAMRLCADNAPVERKTLSKTLHQARTYAQVRMLHQLKLVEMKEIKPLFSEQKYPTGSLEVLKSIDVFTLPLVKNEAH